MNNIKYQRLWLQTHKRKESNQNNLDCDFAKCVFGKWQKSTLTLLYKGFHSYRWEGCKRIQLIIQLT